MAVRSERPGREGGSVGGGGKKWPPEIQAGGMRAGRPFAGYVDGWTTVGAQGMLHRRR